MKEEDGVAERMHFCGVYKVRGLPPFAVLLGQEESFHDQALNAGLGTFDEVLLANNVFLRHSEHSHQQSPPITPPLSAWKC